MVRHQKTRRAFLESAGIGAAMVSLGGRPAAAAATGRSANETIQLGVIGIGPRCTYDLKAMLPFSDLRCVAIADVQKSRRDAGKALVDGHYGDGACRLHRDFRELLADEAIDAVLIATGDRWHADASMLAAKAGKDVYSEKPCGITADLCRRLSETMNETGRIFQAGTQRRSVPNFQRAVDLVHSGKLGTLRKMYASVYIPVLDNTWMPGQPVPDREIVDWNLWLGPSPWRPYNEAYCRGRWRGQWDFDSGARLHDWGAHTVDLCQWANQADDTMPVLYEPYEDRIECTYENGVVLIIDFLKDPFGDRSPHYVTRLGTCPVRFEGENGSVETGDSGEIAASTPALQREVESTKRVRGLDVTAHSRNFLDCMRTRRPTAANPEVMRRSHTACHAAAAAWILGRPVRMDPVTERYVNDPEAEILRTRPARDWASV